MRILSIHFISIALIGLLSLSALAAKKDRYEYEDCLLEHMDHAKLDVASRFIAEACEENYGIAV